MIACPYSPGHETRHAPDPITRPLAISRPVDTAGAGPPGADDAARANPGRRSGARRHSFRRGHGLRLPVQPSRRLLFRRLGRPGLGDGRALAMRPAPVRARPTRPRSRTCVSGGFEATNVPIAQVRVESLLVGAATRAQLVAPRITSDDELEEIGPTRWITAQVETDLTWTPIFNFLDELGRLETGFRVVSFGFDVEAQPRRNPARCVQGPSRPDSAGPRLPGRYRGRDGAMMRGLILVALVLVALALPFGWTFPPRPETPLGVVRGASAPSRLTLRPGDSTVEAVQFLRTLRADPPRRPLLRRRRRLPRLPLRRRRTSPWCSSGCCAAWSATRKPGSFRCFSPTLPRHRLKSQR